VSSLQAVVSTALLFTLLSISRHQFPSRPSTRCSCMIQANIPIKNWELEPQASATDSRNPEWQRLDTKGGRGGKKVCLFNTKITSIFGE
jgi:hypothetical protein